ncbi:MAG: PHP domain-containing protein, partial [Oscillospiraceae bacterium]|nr:PHP domain-containing protein [Oscillospiraceae bacterium]
MAGDLHCHTKLSMGSMGIDELIMLAKKRGISTIAITDQDCQAGNIRGKMIGERHGITVVPGVELSCTNPHNGRELHLLCYLIESRDRLEGLCHANLLARKKAVQYTLLKFINRFAVCPELVHECAKGSTCIYPQHMMRALMESGMTDRICGEIYQEYFTEDSTKNILFPARFPSPFEVLEAIHAAGGVAVLAHPGKNEAVAMLDKLMKAGLDGIEVFHNANSRELQKQLLSMAQGESLLVTGGSDFRGMYGDGSVTLG